MEVTGAGTTVAVVLPFTPFWAALMVTPVEIVATPVARPVGVMLMCAVSLEVQVTVLVMSWVELSLNVPVAVNCCCV